MGPALLSLVLTLPSHPSLEPQVEAGAPPGPVPGLWTQWRGPRRDGSVPGASWPERLSDEQIHETWRIDDLGPSYSGPVVDRTRVYTTETRDEKLEVVRAFDRVSGEELWSTHWQGAMEVPFFAARNGSWIRSTPAVHGDSLFVMGMREVLACLSTETGETRWRVDFGERYGSGLAPFGGVCSPLVTESHVYVQAGAGLVKLDRATGESVWRTMEESDDMTSRGSFSSPVLTELCGRPQLVAQSRSELAGLDPDDGSILWSRPVKSFRGMSILTPTVVGDTVFTSAYGGRSHLFRIHADVDGSYVVDELWNVAEQGYMSSPVVVDGHAYLFLKSNRFGCLDLASGAAPWESGPTRDEYWSLAVQGERILALSDGGTLRLIAADPKEYRVLAERDLTTDETWAHIAPDGNQLFVREQEALVAYRWE